MFWKSSRRIADEKTIRDLKLKTERQSKDLQALASQLKEKETLIAQFEETITATQNKTKSLNKRIRRLRGSNLNSFNKDTAYKRYENKTLINIGAGQFRHERWTNLDVSSEHYNSVRKGEFIEYNIIDDARLPFPTASVSLAYTSHTIEHVKDEHIQRLFSEVYRCMERGGIFRITCPDAGLYYSAFLLRNFDRFFYRKTQWFGDAAATLSPDDIDYLKMAFATQMTASPRIKDEDRELSDECTRRSRSMEMIEFFDWLSSHVEFTIDHISSHINWWTIEKVTLFLKRAGFELVRPSSYGGSVAAPMCDITMFDNTVYDESLYVEAYKI